MQVLELVMLKKRLAASHARAQVYTEMAVHALSSLPAPTPASMLEGASALAQTLRSALPPGRLRLPQHTATAAHAVSGPHQHPAQ